MTNFLAIDTATDACSVALALDGHIEARFELAPRRHNQLVFAMLEAVLPDGRLREQGVEALVYSAGPGSFTGLRIGASAVQGLAFANDLPVVPVSTLAALAQAAWREGKAETGQPMLCLLDARVDEVYWQVFDSVEGLPQARGEPAVNRPEDLHVPDTPAQAVGDGLTYLERFPSSLRGALQHTHMDCWPSARDLLPLAEARFALGETQEAAAVVPVYVRDEVSWKKLSEQGKSA